MLLSSSASFGKTSYINTDCDFTTSCRCCCCCSSALVKGRSLPGSPHRLTILIHGSIKMTLLRGRVEVEESRSVVHPEFGPEAATFDARYCTGGRFVCFCGGVIIVNRTDNHLPPTHPTHLSSLPSTHSHPQQRQSRSLDPRCNQPR